MGKMGNAKGNAQEECTVGGVNQVDQEFLSSSSILLDTDKVCLPLRGVKIEVLRMFLNSVNFDMA